MIVDITQEKSPLHITRISTFTLCSGPLRTLRAKFLFSILLWKIILSGHWPSAIRRKSGKILKENQLWNISNSLIDEIWVIKVSKIINYWIKYDPQIHSNIIRDKRYIIEMENRDDRFSIRFLDENLNDSNEFSREMGKRSMKITKYREYYSYSSNIKCSRDIYTRSTLGNVF